MPAQHRRLRLALPFALASAALTASPAVAQLAAPERTPVDLELVLAVDISPSMDGDEFQIQRDGYVAAFRHEEVIDAILAGPRGQVAVTYMEWGGPYDQYQLVPWTLIASREDAVAFADRLAREPLYQGERTSISTGLLAAAELIESNEYDGMKRVIDISGDGPNNAGQRVDMARDAVAARGITINGLPIVLRREDSFFDIPNLDQYYEDCVISGPGAFTAPVNSLDQLGATIRGKLVLEIVGLPPRFEHAQVRNEEPAERANCLIGELLWQQRGFR
jgi:hypothetical protein